MDNAASASNRDWRDGIADVIVSSSKFYHSSLIILVTPEKSKIAIKVCLNGQ